MNYGIVHTQHTRSQARSPMGQAHKHHTSVISDTKMRNCIKSMGCMATLSEIITYCMDHSNGTGNNTSLARNLHFQSLHLIHAIVMLCASKKDSKCQKV
jgi:hypothetical protein